MSSNRKIERRLKGKKNASLVRTVISSRKQEGWKDIRNKLLVSNRKKKILTLTELNKKSKSGKEFLFIGKVLSQGELEKKIRIVASSFSKVAEKKLLKANCKLSTINEEILKNPKMTGLEIIE